MRYWGPCLQSRLRPHHSLPITSLGLSCFPSKLDLHIFLPFYFFIIKHLPYLIPPISQTHMLRKKKDPEVTVLNPIFIFPKHAFNLWHLIGTGTLYVLSHLALFPNSPFEGKNTKWASESLGTPASPEAIQPGSQNSAVWFQRHSQFPFPTIPLQVLEVNS